MKGNKEPSMNYAEAITRLDEILEDIDQSRISIDVLAERVVEAAGLLKYCKSVLTETEAKVKDVLANLDSEFSDVVKDGVEGGLSEDA